MLDAARLEAHWLACMASLGGGARVTRGPGATIVAHARIPGATMNFMTFRDLHPSDLAETLELGSAVLAGARRPPALYLAPPAGDCEGLGAALSAAGWREAVRQVVLVRDLTGLPPVPESTTVVNVGPERLAEWGEALVQAYEVEPVAGEAIRQGWTSLSSGDPSYYLAMADGRPVATGLAWRQGELAGLYAGAVLPAYRRQGIARCLMERRLADSQKAGAHWAFLQTEVGSPVIHLAVERLGFTVAYERALWIPM